jgi:ribosome maturation factor RimP
MGEDFMEAEGLRELVDTAVERAGLLLVDLQLVRTGRRVLLRVLADRKDRITVGECASLSREISDLVDAHGILESDYTLEVSSPGIGRPLSTMVDWERCQGRTLFVKTSEFETTGLLLGHDTGSLFMEGEVTIPFETVLEAREVI